MMENSIEISSFMYLEFGFMYECEEELNSSIVMCVHTLFCECLPLIELEHGIRASVILLEYWRAYCKIL
jgi:hypothetical protein